MKTNPAAKSFRVTLVPRLLIVLTVSIAGGASSASAACATGSPWSSPGTWAGGHVPLAGEDVTIDMGQTVCLDGNSASLGGLTVMGSLVFDDAGDRALTAKWIMLHGVLQVGTEAARFTHKAVITLTDPDTNGSQMGMGTRGIMVMGTGATLDLHGVVPSPVWTKLSAHAGAGAGSLSLISPVNWAPGSQIVIAPTDYYSAGHTELLTVASSGGNTVNLSSPLQKARWGILQYFDNSGVTLSPTTSDPRKMIDERAEVGNLTRNIVIQAPDDAAWQNSGFGAHVMGMQGAVMRVDGVEFTRVGQAGKLARYPFHWHLMSYDPNTGAELGDVTGQYIKNSAIHGSANRCITIHGTNGGLVDNNVCYDVKGHAVFEENAVERRNVISNNLVLGVRFPSMANRLLASDTDRTGSSGFWLTNPDNTVTGNVAADSEGGGFWLAFPTGPLGPMKSVPIIPSQTVFGVVDGNTAHSNKQDAWMFDNPPDPNDPNGGVVGGNKFANGQTVKMTNFTMYKQDGKTQWNDVVDMEVSGYVVADFSGGGFTGNATFCRITDNLVVGTSLNNATAPNRALNGFFGMASYHSSCGIDNNVIVNIPADMTAKAGAFRTNDYYIAGVDKGLVQNAGNRLINTHPGYRSPSPNKVPSGTGPQPDGTRGHENMSLAGALHDPYGLWGKPGSYWVYNDPFLTYGTACSDVKQPFYGNDKTCAGPYYGFRMMEDFDGPVFANGEFQNSILFHRNDNNAEWLIDDARCTTQLGSMRTGTLVKGGDYTVAFPAGQGTDDAHTCTPAQFPPAPPPPRWLSFSATNLLTADDGFVVGIEYSGAAVPAVYRTSWPDRWGPKSNGWASWTAYANHDPTWKSQYSGQYWQPLLPTASLENVRNGDGNYFWQDTANNRIWMRVNNHGLTPVIRGPGDNYFPVYVVVDNRYTLWTPPPQAPTNLAAAAASDTQVSLSWKDNSYGEDKFQVAWSLDGVAFNNVVDAPFASGAGGTVVFSHPGRTANTTYYYRVLAHNNAGGDSAPSNVVSIKTLPAGVSDNMPPARPKNLAMP